MRKADAVIIGFTKERGRRSAFGALVLGCFDEGRLAYMGLAATGFGREKQALYERLMRLEADNSPFAEKLPIKSKIVWLKPLLIAEIGYENAGSNGRYSGIRFLGLKDSLSATEVRRKRR